MYCEQPAAHQESPLPEIRSIGILCTEQRERRAGEDVEIEQQRPVLDVEEVVLHASLDFLGGIGLTAPAVNLRPAGDAGFYAMTGKITVHCIIIEPLCRLGIHRMGA